MPRAKNTKTNTAVSIKQNTVLDWENALRRFILELRANGKAKRTIDDYEYHVNLFFKRHPQAAQISNLQDKVFRYFSQTVRPATFNLRHKYLNGFFKWCVKEAGLPFNPLDKIRKRKAHWREAYVENEDVVKLLKVIRKDTFAGLRDYALLLLSIDTGIRPGEALALLPTDFYLDSATIIVPPHAAKTGKQRVLPLTAATAQAIVKLINARHPDWKEHVPLFCTEDGGKMSVHHWYNRLRQYSKKAGLKIYPYAMRHYFATESLTRECDIYSLAAVMGHETLEMIRNYLTITTRKVRDWHAKASPVHSVLGEKRRLRKIH